jgi:hypothetical protein
LVAAGSVLLVLCVVLMGVVGGLAGGLAGGFTGLAGGLVVLHRVLGGLGCSRLLVVSVASVVGLA